MIPYRHRVLVTKNVHTATVVAYTATQFGAVVLFVSGDPPSKWRDTSQNVGTHPCAREALFSRTVLGVLTRRACPQVTHSSGRTCPTQLDEVDVTLSRAQSRALRGRRLFLYTAVPTSRPKRAPATWSNRK